jgi:hypothetical protein
VDHYFAFNQPPDIGDCGWRSIQFILKLKLNIKETLQDLKNYFSILNPNKNGLFLVDLYRMFSYYNIQYKVSIPTQFGLYVIFYNHGKDYGHFVIYKDGLLFDSNLDGPKQITVEELQKRLESEHNGSILCIKIV